MKRKIRLTEGVLRRIIRESLSEIDFGNISKIDNGHVTPYSPEDRERNFLGLKYGRNNAYEGYKKWYERMKDVLPKEELNWDNYVANYQEKFSNLLESVVRKAVNESLSEISPEMLARAYVGSNVDRNNIGSSDDDTVVNRNGNVVHRKTQADRRDRQMRAFRERLGSELSKKLGRNIKISKGDIGSDSSYYGEVGRGQTPVFHHYSNVNGDDPTSVYHDDYDRKIGKGDMDASNYVSNLVDAMAGYHDELTGGKEYQDRFNRINDRVNDVENLQKYNKDKEEYEERRRRNRQEIEDFNSLPWYKKLGKKAPQKSTEEEPKAPETKTGPYFMPNEPDGLLQQGERLKATREKNRDAYDKYLKKK